MPMKFYSARIARIVNQAPHVNTYMCEIPEGFSWKPGSFVHVGLPGFQDGKPNRELVHPLSICTLQREGYVAFTTRLNSSDSEFKRRLAGLQVGDTLTFFKLMCEVELPRKNRPVVYLTQGVGLAAIRPLLLVAAEDMQGIPSFTSITVSPYEESLFASDLVALEQAGAVVQHVQNRQDFAAAVGALPNASEAIFTVVGAMPFMKATIAQLRSMGVNDDDILIDGADKFRKHYFED